MLPASAGISGTQLRKINEEVWLNRIVPDARGEKRRLLILKATDETVAKLAEKGASAEVARRLLDKVGAKKDDTVLVGVDQPGPVAMAMGILRLEMGRELKLVDEKAYRFLWVTDFPLFEWDRETGRHASLHHPFTAPADEDIALLDTDPARVRAKAYDVVLNGYEVGGGSLRIHDSAMQAKVFQLLAHLGRGGPRPLRLLPRGPAVRHAAARRDRTRPRPHGHDHGRRDLAAAGHRLPEDGERDGPAGGIALPGARRAGAGPRPDGRPEVRRRAVLSCPRIH